MNNFRLTKKSNKSQARTAILKTPHGNIKTPFFMPVATQGTIKHIHSGEMLSLGAQILLSNTYHLMLRPGPELIKRAGGIHRFMNWPRPVLTDSGGFQVFSLSDSKNKTGKSLVKIDKNGVEFRSYFDGQKHNLTPEKALQIQMDLGVDIAVCLDECISLPADKKEILKSVQKTTDWALKTKNYHKKQSGNKPLLFGVIQGGLDKQLRLKSLEELVDIGFDGYNIGGLSVGESARDMYRIVDFIAPRIPQNKPRYLMGVGYPENILHAVKQGVDMFDCVIPTREGRHGRLFSWNGPRRFNNNSFYETLNIKSSKFRNDFSPINKNSKINELKDLSKAYLHYLFKVGEPLGARLASLNNLEFYLDFMSELRKAIKNNKI